MNKTILALSAATVLCIVVGCKPSAPPAHSATSADALERVLSRGELRAGYFVQPPAVMKDPNSGEVYGTFIEAIKEIAKEIGVKLTLTEVDLAKFTAGLQNDQYDVSVGPTFRTITRAKAVAFTDTIFYLGYDGVTKKGRGQSFKKESDVDKKGIKVAVKEGSAIHTYAKRNFKNAEVIVLSGTDLSLPLQAVSSGQADVGLMNEHTVEHYARANPDVEIVLADNPIQVVGMSWAVRPHDYRWHQFLNTSIEAMVSTGQMAAWERKIYGKPLRRTLVEPSEPTVGK
jgi:ABC-type amino acid transport substrate-binding protein